MKAATIPVPALDSEPALQLAGFFTPGTRAAAVIAPPHPVYGGRCDNPVVQAVSRGLMQADVAVLGFNFRGTGGSSGAMTDDPRSASADFAAAIAHLREQHPGPYIATGYSFGAATALRATRADTRLTRALLIAPPLAMLDLEALRRLSRPVTIALGDDDEYAPLAELQDAIAGLAHVELQAIAGADHFFSMGGLDQLSALSRSFGAEPRLG